MAIEAFPLAWPAGWHRTPHHQRARARFSRKGRGWVEGHGYEGSQNLTIAQALERVMNELRTMNVDIGRVIISTNLALRNDGLPRSGQRMPDDPGASVYWNARGQKSQRCMAIDRYDRVQDNLAAIAATLSAMRAIERHGGAEILDRAFTGFVALPAPEQPFQVLGVGANASKEEVERAYRLLASEHHPDRGGDADQMARINRARDVLLEGL
jgi:DnaJ domain